VIVERSVLVTREQCRRFATLLDVLVRRHARECGVPVGADLAELLREMRDVALSDGASPAASGHGVEGGSRGIVAATTSTLSSFAVAARVGISSRAVRLAAEQGRLRGVRDAAGRWRFEAGDVDQFEQTRRSRRG
jgi:hypothetical protein